MVCMKCKKEIADGSSFCNWCGFRQGAHTPTKKAKSRGNGQGSVYKLPNGKYAAEVTLGYIDGKRKKKTKQFNKKQDAVNYLPLLKQTIEPIDKKISFAKLYELFITQHSEKVGKTTIDCYKAAYKHFEPLHFIKFSDIKTEQLQRCVESVSGTRTRENMKALGTLMYKYALQNDIAEKNYAQYIYVGKKEKSSREAFSVAEREIIKSCVGKVKYAEYILCLIYTGFRPNEMLSLKKSDYYSTYFIGGSKTEAGKNRIVPIPAVIASIVSALVEKAESEYIFESPTHKRFSPEKFRDHYYSALEEMGLRKLPPYSCRHTYATMLKDINAPITDKQKLMGHESFEMTAHYTHTDIESLTKISDQMV